MEQYATLIIGYRRPDLVRAVLDQLASQTDPPSQVILIDNGGDIDPSVLTGSTFRDNGIFISRPDNPGYGAAVNEARTLLNDGVDRLLVLTHDAVFGSDLAAGLTAALAHARRAGAVGPLLRLVSRPTRIFSAGGRLTSTGRAWNTVSPDDEQTPYEVDWVDGAIVLFRVDALDEIGWLDEGYFLYFEDVDTSWRLRRAGWSVLIAPSVVARQEPGAHPMYLGIRNMTLFAQKAGIPAWRSLLGVTRRVVEEAAYRVLHHRTPGLWDAWRGWRDGRRGLTGHPAEPSVADAH